MVGAEGKLWDLGAPDCRKTPFHSPNNSYDR